jgi:hypothetical protein
LLRRRLNPVTVPVGVLVTLLTGVAVPLSVTSCWNAPAPTFADQNSQRRPPAPLMIAVVVMVPIVVPVSPS